MRIEDRTLLITGANRGIGRALVEEALNRGAARVYAGTRTSWTHPDPRVTPLPLEGTDAEQIRRAAERVETLDILVNNAGVARYDDLTDPSVLDSKAAAFSMTQSLRALLTDRGVSVHAVLTGIVDTDMSRGVDIPKASPRSVAHAILDAVAKAEEDIFPDLMAQSMAEDWHGGAAKTLERQYAALFYATRAAATPAGA